MRPIKFRAWDKEKKEMIEPMDLYGWSGFLSNPEQFDADLAFMQFTSLLDKNGKEIYEGDIVRLHCFNHNLITATIEWLDDAAKFIPHIHDKKIKVDGGTSHGKMEDMKTVHSWAGSHSCFSFERYTEVIGNIYENPDSLNQGR